MKIIAVHKGFACDHSSTSYEFPAVDKPLDERATRAVASLSRRAIMTSLAKIATMRRSGSLTDNGLRR